MPSESPTSTTSTPAPSAAAAKLASYAVTATIFSPRRLRSRSSGTFNGGPAGDCGGMRLSGAKSDYSVPMCRASRRARFGQRFGTVSIHVIEQLRDAALARHEQPGGEIGQRQQHERALGAVRVRDVEPG